MAFYAMADCRLISGNPAILLNSKYNVPVFLNWDNAVYNRSGSLQDFLWEEPRSPKWEELSLRAFLFNVNSKTSEYGVRFSSPVSVVECDFAITMFVHKIDRDGDIEGVIVIHDASGQNEYAAIRFKSDDADDDDYSGFTDQMESIGSSFGDLCKRSFRYLY